MNVSSRIAGIIEKEPLPNINERLVELQKALSDMQIYLFQEREHVLRLYAENDRLKIRELEDKKKIQQLLALSGTPDSEITYFHKEPPAKAVKIQRNRPHLRRKAALHCQLKINTSMITKPCPCKSKLCSLKSKSRLNCPESRLHKTQDLLYESTKDFLELRYQGRASERLWMAEKDKLLRELDQCKQKLNISPKDDILTTPSSYDTKSHYIEELKSLEYQLQQSQKLSEMYREQVIQLEDELSRIREEGDVTREIFKDRGDKMGKRLKLMNQRYQDLERRRNLEVEGFKTDIKNLRTRLKDVERQLYKVTIGFSEDMDAKRPDDLDMQILRNIRATSGRSKKMVGELKNLKAKMYSIENDMKHL
ncbi:CCD77-like protein [Mya arenaria]|uniref:CCD77-like protein n=1 Tax=Mya arenaria TaxID=6604 RepID=A0ABY7FYB9_MYAAR|nr:CCD77-like protein [Mya arenaria]